MSDKKKGIWGLVAFVAFTILLFVTVLIGIGPTHTGSAQNIRLGLDLAGGVSITYEAVGDVTDEEMEDTKYKMQLRVQNYSTEADVYREGSNRITVEIPGVTDANTVLQELGKPGALVFYDKDFNEVMTGSDVQAAEPMSGQDPTTGLRKYYVNLKLTPEGATKFAEATTKAAENQDIIYIIYDGAIISYPSVKTPITDGECTIEGMANYDQANKLATTIRIGALPIELQEISSKIVGAKMGGEAIETSLFAGAIAFVLITIFMIVAYRMSGVVASLALAIYTALTMGCLNAFDLTLTLPGIAGIVLSVGMAVDANVIIYARIQEEITAGRTVRKAIDIGFKKAASAIIDGNVTTLIAAVVLLLKGTGTVKGFAQTLIVGLVLSLITALIVSKALLLCFYWIGVQDEKFYGRMKERKTIDFVKNRKIFYAISIVCVLSGFVFLIVNKNSTGSILNYSIDFAGGTATTVTLNEELTLDEFEAKVVPIFTEQTKDVTPQAQKVEGTTSYVVKTQELDQNTRAALSTALCEQLQIEESAITAETISPTISNEMRGDAAVAVVIATILMLIYIWFRFRDIKFAASAIIALIHDILIVFAYYSIMRAAVGSDFIACMLTILGYSINDTIVTFDRIRENINQKTKDSLKVIVNKSVTQTLTRSIYTSLMTLICLIVLYLFGVASIKQFSLPLIVGIVAGLFSSVFITSPLWLDMKNISSKLKEKKAKSV